MKISWPTPKWLQNASSFDCRSILKTYQKLSLTPFVLRRCKFLQDNNRPPFKETERIWDGISVREKKELALIGHRHIPEA